MNFLNYFFKYNFLEQYKYYNKGGLVLKHILKKIAKSFIIGPILIILSSMIFGLTTIYFNWNILLNW